MSLKASSLLNRRLLGSRLAVVVVLACASWTSHSAVAQNDPLAAICHGFLSSSGLPSPGNATVLCRCLVEEVQANLTMAEMQAYQSATNSGRSAPAAVESKVSAIAVNCLRKAQ